MTEKKMNIVDLISSVIAIKQNKAKLEIKQQIERNNLKDELANQEIKLKNYINDNIDINLINQRKYEYEIDKLKKQYNIK
jgi:hypothetical protein